MTWWLIPLKAVAPAAADWVAHKLRRDIERDEKQDAATRERQRHGQAAGASAHRAGKEVGNARRD